MRLRVWRVFACGRTRIQNQPRTALPGDAGPHPLQKDSHTQIALRQKLQVHHSPYKPREESAELDLSRLQDGETLANHRHVSFVPVTKRRELRFADNPTVNQLPHVASLLHRDLRDARQGLSILFERC